LIHPRLRLNLSRLVMLINLRDICIIVYSHVAFEIRFYGIRVLNFLVALFLILPIWIHFQLLFLANLNST
jgi:hypothetical protein